MYHFSNPNTNQVDLICSPQKYEYLPNIIAYFVIASCILVFIIHNTQCQYVSLTEEAHHIEEHAYSFFPKYPLLSFWLDDDENPKYCARHVSILLNSTRRDTLMYLMYLTLYSYCSTRMYMLPKVCKQKTLLSTKTEWYFCYMLLSLQHSVF